MSIMAVELKQKYVRLSIIVVDFNPSISTLNESNGISRDGKNKYMPGKTETRLQGEMASKCKV